MAYVYLRTKHTYTCWFINLHIHTNTDAYLRRCTCTGSCRCSWNVYMHAYMHTYIHACIHAYMHNKYLYIFADSCTCAYPYGHIDTQMHLTKNVCKKQIHMHGGANKTLTRLYITVQRGDFTHFSVEHTHKYKRGELVVQSMAVTEIPTIIDPVAQG
jgi:hypothetical protein